MGQCLRVCRIYTSNEYDCDPTGAGYSSQSVTQPSQWHMLSMAAAAGVDGSLSTVFSIQLSATQLAVRGAFPVIYVMGQVAGEQLLGHSVSFQASLIGTMKCVEYDIPSLARFAPNC